MMLQSSDCKFIGETLVNRYKQHDDLFAWIATNLPGLDQQRSLRELRERHLALAELLQRSKFCFGVVGRPRVGKSLTVSCLLELPAEEGPGCCGADAGLTSAATRVQRQPLPARAITLEFMSELEYQSRAAALCALLGIDFTQPAEARQARANELCSEHPHDPRSAYLGALLQAYEDNKYVLGTTDSDSGIYEERRSYLAPQAADYSPYPLLRCMLVQFPKSLPPEETLPGDDSPTWLPENVELLDLPGLVCSDKADDTLTQSLLLKMDAVLVCQTLTDGPSLELLARLHEAEHRERLRGRIWMLLTQADSLPQDGAEPLPQDDADARPKDGAGEWQAFTEVLERFEIPPERVLLIGNARHQQQAAQRAEATLDREQDAELSRDLPVPDWLAAGGTYDQARGELALDGGIGHLRRMLDAQLVQLQAQLHQRIAEGLAEVKPELERLLQAETQRAAMQNETLALATTWEFRLGDLAGGVVHEHQLFEEPAGELQSQLIRDLESLCGANPEAVVTVLQHNNVSGTLELKARALAGACPPAPPASALSSAAQGSTAATDPVETGGPPQPAVTLGPGTLQQIFAGATRKLAEIDAPAFEIGAGADRRMWDPQAKWQRDVDRLLRSPDWATDVFRGFREDEFADVEQLKRSVYVSVMTRKIRHLVYGFVVRVVQRIKELFASYQAEVGILCGGGQPAGKSVDQTLSQLHEKLKRLEG